MTFEAMLYTDARPTEAHEGRNGFQVQAASAGIDDQDLVIARQLVYPVPQALLGSGTPIDRFPESFAHFPSGGRSYLARGRYLGNVEDGRSGNQATHILVTSDPVDRGFHRPAQTFGAPVWRPEKAPSATLDVVPGPLIVEDAFEIDALHATALEAPDAAEALAALATMVEEAAGGGRRLILVHDDTATIVRSIAIGTLLLDPDAAWALPFQVPSTRPLADADFPVVGTSAAVLGEPFPVDQPGVNVIDLVSWARTEVAVSARTRRHVRWFLDQDPYEAIEAIRLGRRWATVADAAPADIAAAAVVLHRHDQRDAGAAAAAVLLGLTRSDDRTHVDDLTEHGAELVAMVEGAATSDELAVIVGLHWELCEAGRWDLATRTLLTLLALAAADPRVAEGWAQHHVDAAPASASQPLPWSEPSTRRRAAALLADAIDGAPDRALPALLTLAADLDTGVPFERVQSSLRRLADRWSIDPGLTDRSSQWLFRQETVPLVWAALGARVQSAYRAEVGAALRDGRWNWLLREHAEMAADDPLAPWAAGIHVRSLDPSEGAEQLAIYARGYPSTDWDAFFTPGDAPDPALLEVWLRNAPRVDPNLGGLIDSVVASLGQNRLTASRAVSFLDVVATQRPPGVSARTQRLADDSVQFRKLIGEALERAEDVPNPAVEALAHCDSRLFIVYQRSATDLVYVSRDTRSTAQALAAARVDVGGLVASKLRSELEVDPIDAFGRGLELWSFPDWPGTLRREVEEVLVAWWAHPDHEQDVNEIQQRLTPEGKAILADLERSSGVMGKARRSVGRLLDRRDRSADRPEGGSRGQR